MPDFPRALDDALRARYGVPGVRTPATQARGLTARMNALEKAHTAKGDRAGAAGKRAAQSAGISPGTWTRWRSGKQKPGAAMLAKLEAAYAKTIMRPKLARKILGQPLPTSAKVSGKVCWNGYYNKVSHRTVNLALSDGTMRDTINKWAYGELNRTGPDEAAKTFLKGAASDNQAAYILIEEDDCHVEFED